MNNPGISTDLGSLSADEPYWTSKSSFRDDMDNDGSMEKMLPDPDPDVDDDSSITKMISSGRRESVSLAKQARYMLHRIPTAEASRLTLKKATAKAFSDDLGLRDYRTPDFRRRCGLLLLFAAFLFCVTGTVLMWCTNLFGNLVLGTMVISNSSNTWEWWRAPPVTPLLKVYIFNYTNADNFVRTGEKLRVKQVGPITYAETTEKVDVVFHDNGTLSYREKKTYTFLPEMSDFPEDAVVFVPNIPFLSSLATVRNDNFLARFALNTLLRTLDSKPILRVNVRDLLFGYDDSLFEWAKFAAINGRIPFHKFGLMVPKVGVSEHVVTVHTGSGDMDRLGQITHDNGRDSLNLWGSDECNQLQGSDGSQFPPLHVTPSARLYVYNRDMCRRVPLVFKDYTEAQGLPAYRFHMPRDVFESARTNENNRCFCTQEDVEDCLPSGVVDASACNFGAPLLMSFPHFFLGDSSLYKNVDGLHPDPEKHDMFVDIHPKLGLTLGGVSRLQLNVQVKLASQVQEQTMAHFKDHTVLPVAWFELIVTEFPKPLLTLLYHATVTVRIVELALMYGFLAGSIASAAVLCRRVFLRKRGGIELSSVQFDSDSA